MQGISPFTLDAIKIVQFGWVVSEKVKVFKSKCTKEDKIGTEESNSLCAGFFLINKYFIDINLILMIYI